MASYTSYSVPGIGLLYEQDRIPIDELEGLEDTLYLGYRKWMPTTRLVFATVPKIHRVRYDAGTWIFGYSYGNILGSHPTFKINNVFYVLPGGYDTCAAGDFLQNKVHPQLVETVGGMIHDSLAEYYGRTITKAELYTQPVRALVQVTEDEELSLRLAKVPQVSF